MEEFLCQEDPQSLGISRLKKAEEAAEHQLLHSSW